MFFARVKVAYKTILALVELEAAAGRHNSRDEYPQQDRRLTRVNFLRNCLYSQGVWITEKRLTYNLWYVYSRRYFGPNQSRRRRRMTA